MKVLALDPGGTTGWVLYTLKEETYGLTEKWDEGQLGPEEHHVDLYMLINSLCMEALAQNDEFIVVCESFEFRQNRQRDNINLMSKEYIGVVKLIAQTLGIPVVFQTAGAAKPFVTDQKLKAMLLYSTNQRHANDAKRHAVFYLVTKKKLHHLVETWKKL